MLWHRRYPWQPCKWPPRGTVTMNHSVEYLSSNTYPTISSTIMLPYRRKMKGGMGKKQQGNRQQARLLVRAGGEFMSGNKASAFTVNSHLRIPCYYGHSLLRTKFRSPSIEVRLKMTPGITDSHYSRHNDVLKVSV